MHPVLFKAGPITIYSYGVMVALGFAVAIFLANRRAGRFGLSGDLVVDLLITALVTGIAGARLFYIILSFQYYRANPMEILDLSKGGLVWYGGFFMALASVALFIKVKRMGFWNTMDLLAPYIVLAQALGRIGCFLNGCCYGISGIPVQLYASLSLFAIFIVLRLWQEVRRFNGEIFLGYCILYSLKRFGIEFLRGDNPRAFFGLTISQVISIAVVLVSAAIFLSKAYKWNAKDTASK
jgi:phosphatidylglycerol:prolipoprotein diacylglycerol transferase